MKRLLLTLLAVAACDVPTALPRLETRLVLPGETTRVTVNELLPASISIADGAFEMDLGARSIPRTTVRDICSACAAFDGQLVPKPAFVATIPVTLEFPDELHSAILTSGAIAVNLSHDFGFDPLQPAGRTQDGSIRVEVRSAGRAVGETLITGPFPSGSTRTASVQLTTGEIADEVTVDITITSPAGGTAPSHWVRIDADAGLSGAVTPGTLRIAEARVNVQGRQLSPTGQQIDLTGIDETMRDRVVRGALIIEVESPFELTDTLQLRLETNSISIVKSVLIAPDVTTQRLEFTREELRQLLGSIVDITLSGTLDSGTPVTIRPADEVTVSTMFDLTFEIGGTGS